MKRKTAIIASQHLCPECDSQMVVKFNRTTGNEFHGCMRFPKCYGTRTPEGRNTTRKSARGMVNLSDFDYDVIRRVAEMIGDMTQQERVIAKMLLKGE